MTDYRLYCLDGSGQIASPPEIVKAPSEEEAIRIVRALGLPHVCELWLGGRLIATIPAAPKD